MQDARTLIPSFGSWDTGTEIPFTAVFEKVRATKDGKPLDAMMRENASQTAGGRQYCFEGKPSMIHPQYVEVDKVCSELPQGKRSRSIVDEGVLFQRKNSDLQSSSSRRSSLEQIADHIFAESQHAAGTDSPVISRQSTSSNTSWQNSQPICTRDSKEQYVRESLYSSQLVPVSLPPALQYVKENVYNRAMPGALPSVHHQGYQAMIGSRMMPKPGAYSPRRERFFPDDIAEAGSLYPLPAMHVHQQSIQTKHLSAEMSPKKVLPKFGDWDAIDPAAVEFTVIFDKARNERKCSIIQDSSIRNKADLQVDEDLYKPNSGQRRTGFWALLCCNHSPAS